MPKRGATAGDAPEAGDEALDEIYLGDFDGFVGRRDELAKQLRFQGDKEAASRARALRKPSRVAWAVNQLSGRELELRDELLDAGATLRGAQERVVAGEAGRAELRAAGEHERDAVSRALDAVEALAEGAGAKLSPAAVERARQTLHAVALDEDVRREFERHRLTTDREAAGLAGLAPGAAPTSGKRATRTDPKDGVRRAEERRREELEAAEAEVRKLERRQQKAEREMEAARQTAEQAQQHLERAANELAKATSEAAAARERFDDLRNRSP